jgi:hypothetical protein
MQINDIVVTEPRTGYIAYIRTDKIGGRRIMLCNRWRIYKQAQGCCAEFFSSPNLFRALREAGHGATGTDRPNCGITKELKLTKGKDKAGVSGFKYNEVKSISTIDGLVRPRDLFICISLTNSFFLGRSNRLEG